MWRTLPPPSNSLQSLSKLSYSSLSQAQSRILGHTFSPSSSASNSLNPFRSIGNFVRPICISNNLVPALSHPRTFSNLGRKNVVGLKVSQGLDGKEVMVRSGRRLQHASTAEESKAPAETTEEGLTITESCMRVCFSSLVESSLRV